MKEQTEILRGSVAAAQASAQAAIDQIQMMKDRERARISVSISEEEIEVGVNDFDAIIINVTNDGPTSAFNVKAMGHAMSQQREELPFMGPMAMIPLKIPSVIRANNEPTPVEITFYSSHDLRGFHESAVPYFFHAAGVILYDDVFGVPWKTTFRYRQHVFGVRESAETKRVRVRSMQGWRKTPNPEENQAT
ncbi:MAG: hypothetical protein WBE76_23960 [Terracidiphilus sp.]